MKNRLLNLFVLLLLGSTFILTACQRDNEDAQAAIEAESAEDNALAEGEFTSLDSFVEDASAAEPLLAGSMATAASLPSCATTSYNRDSRTLTIDFGTTNCLCRDGLYRRGKLVAVFNGSYGEVGSSVTITPQNYFVNDNQIAGTKVRTHLGNRKMSVVVTGASITTPKGTATWQANRVIEKIAGYDTPIITDDVWLITGEASGVNRRGVAYTAVIEQPLKKVLSFGCARNFVSGVLTITNQRGGTLSVNYDPIGGEPCDKVAEVTINGRKKLIQLR
ncbi:hypothetical protein [Pontibacter cellulosilyticus]|uniref:Lipoprotein n=1 Tax=Pontibacter cellulosilyticus TaxID=1720253 RepID=A0A923NAR0_9BACT|nr:hypothetical protein [Pontibacter cellulosilyticus]MBC5994947.1 hypothetical protein [Pontibacter cellulosilyticus]